MRLISIPCVVPFAGMKSYPRGLVTQASASKVKLCLWKLRDILGGCLTALTDDTTHVPPGPVSTRRSRRIRFSTTSATWYHTVTLPPMSPMSPCHPYLSLSTAGNLEEDPILGVLLCARAGAPPRVLVGACDHGFHSSGLGAQFARSYPNADQLTANRPTGGCKARL